MPIRAETMRPAWSYLKSAPMPLPLIFVQQGIDKSRLLAKGMGETKLLSKCTECTKQTGVPNLNL